VDGSKKRIVVGVDGSDHSRAALRWALGQARLSGASLDAVTAWRYPVTYGLAVLPGELDMENDSAKALAEAVAEAGGGAPGVEIRQLVGEGPAAEVLLNASKGADLLVVGSRGLGEFKSAFLGSVGLACAIHAKCPVVVYREKDSDDATAG
jgi:nucleotide-binding universal stress UspA family protein